MDEKHLNGADIHKETTREVRPRDYNDPLAQVNFLGHWYSHAEMPLVHQQHEARMLALSKTQREEWLNSEGGRLCVAFYQAFHAYKNYVTQNPRAEANARDIDSKYQPEHALFAMGLRV